MAEPVTPDPAAAPAPRQKSAAELEAEIAETRARLASTLEELRIQTQPANLARHGLARVTAVFTDEYGGVRPERVAIAVVGVVGLIVLRRWRTSRRCHCP